MTPEVANLTVDRSLELMAAGDLRSVELVEALAASITERNPTLNAYVHLDLEAARAEAAAADAARAAGHAGPLCGIPIAIKDVLNVRGQPCTCGSRDRKSTRLNSSHRT